MDAFFVRKAQSAEPSRRPLAERTMNAEEKESLQSKKRAILGDGDQNKSTATILSLWERKKASNDQQQPAPVECTQNDSAEHPDATIELAATEAVEAESPALRRSSRRRTTIISISDDDDDDIVESKPSPQKRKVPRLFETKADRKARADKKKREIEADELFLAEKRAKEEARKKAQDEERAELARKRQRQLKEMQTSAFGGGGNGTGFFSKRSKPIVTIDLVNCTEEPVIQRKPLSKRIWTMPLFPTASMISRQSLSDVVTPNSNVSPSQKEIPVSSSSANAEQTAASRENLSMNLVHYSLHNEKDSPLQHALDRLRNLPRRTNHNKLWIDQHSRQFAGSARVALDSISEWLTSRWGSALEAASSESGQKFIEYDEYFDSDDEGVESASLGASLIVGPVGTGKTAVAKAAAHFCGFEVLELDTSESCSASELKSLFVEATQSHRLTSRTLFLIDIDAPALNADKSFARALRKLVLSAKCPVVATATCDTAADLAYAVGCARHHILSRVSKDELSDFLIEVVGRRNLSGGDDADWQLVGGHIAARTKGDTRRAINELQLLLATDCIQVDEDYPVEEDSPSYVQGVAVATPDDDHISPRAVPTVPEGFPAVNSIEVEGAPRVIGISPRQLSASSDTTLTITARLDDEILLSVYVGETACSEVTATRADGDTYFTVTAVVPRPTHLDTAYAQVLLVSFPPRLRLEQDNRTQITRDGRRSDFAIADRYADIVTVEFIGNLQQRRRRLRRNLDNENSDIEDSEIAGEGVDGPMTHRRRKVICDDDDDSDEDPSESILIPLPCERARQINPANLKSPKDKVLSSIAAAADIRSLGDVMRYHAIEADADEPGPFTVGRGWPQCGSLALMSNEMSKGASALEEPEVLPPACQIKFKSTHLALMAAQTDGTIVPRAHTATLETEYAPALRSLVTSEASNAACSARRRFRYSYWFEDTGGASIGYT